MDLLTILDRQYVLIGRFLCGHLLAIMYLANLAELVGKPPPPDFFFLPCKQGFARSRFLESTYPVYTNGMMATDSLMVLI